MKQNMGRKLLSLLLALAMVVGLLPGLCAAEGTTPGSPLDKAALETAIAAVEAYIKTLADNPAYAETVKALNAALEAAKAVLAQVDVTQVDLSGALTAILAALDKARADAAGVADQAAAQTVEAAINLLPVNAGVNERVAVAEARALYEGLTEAQKKLVSAAALEKLRAAEQRIREADDAAAGRVSIEACRITVKDQTYTGDVVRPAVRVRYNGVKLKKGTDYRVIGYSNNLNVGVATVTVQGLGNFTDVAKQTFRVNPAGTAFAKLKGGNGRITLTWEQVAGIQGYQIEYGLQKDLSDGRQITVRGAGTLTKTIRGLKPGMTYYARIRTYAKVDRKTFCSAWTWPKAVRTKGAAANAAPVAAVDDNILDPGAGEIVELEALADEEIVAGEGVEIEMEGDKF